MIKKTIALIFGLSYFALFTLTGQPHKKITTNLCSENIVISTNHTSNLKVKALSNIQSNVTVETGINIEYIANEFIELTTGFNTQLNSDFYALIDEVTCENNMSCLNDALFAENYNNTTNSNWFTENVNLAANTNYEQTFIALALLPDNAGIVRIGIVKDGDLNKFVDLEEGTNSYTINFIAPVVGKYSIYVQNQNNSELSIKNICLSKG